MNRALFLIIPISLLLAVIQSAFFARVTFLGHIPQLLVLVAISWVIVRNLYEGLLWGLIGGLFLDLYSAGTLGANSIAIMIAVGLASVLRELLPRGNYLIPALVGTLCAVAYIAVYAALAQLSGFTVAWSFFQDLTSYMVLHALLMVPIYWLTIAATRVTFPEPIE